MRRNTYRRPNLRSVFLPQTDEVARFERQKYPVFVNREDISDVLRIVDYVQKKDSYRRSRKTKRGRSRGQRRLQRSLMDSISDHSDFSGFNEHGSTQDIILQLLQFYQEQQLKTGGRRPNLPHALEFLNPNLFQNLRNR